jgi:hypothetical protein
MRHGGFSRSRVPTRRDQMHLSRRRRRAKAAHRRRRRRVIPEQRCIGGLRLLELPASSRRCPQRRDRLLGRLDDGRGVRQLVV